MWSRKYVVVHGPAGRWCSREDEMGTDDGNEAEAGGQTSRRSAPRLDRLDHHVRVHLRHLELLSDECWWSDDLRPVSSLNRGSDEDAGNFALSFLQN